MIDFTNTTEELNNYKGSEKKKTLRYEGKKYLVKFPDPIREKNKNISYINNAFSEYVGSNVFRILGFETQNTILGQYEYNGKKKIVCACEDFTDADNVLYEFESLVLSANPDKKIETEVSDIMEVLKECANLIDFPSTVQKFWDMFIVDALIGNTDRHNGNWGFLLNKQTGETRFAPIYDCGSCLNPMIDDEELLNISETEFKNFAVNCYSCLKENNKKINYITYINSMKNSECNSALIRIYKDIKIDDIDNFIKNIEGMSEIRKNFYMRIIRKRYEMLSHVYNKLCEMKGE